MTQSEVVTLRIDMLRRWPHSAANMQSVDEYHQTLQRFNAHQVRAAVEALDADGVKFAPRGSGIVGKLAELYIDAPDWYAVLSEARVRRASSGHRAAATIGRVCPVNECDGDGWSCRGDDGNIIRYWETFEKPSAMEPCRCREQLLNEAKAQQSAHPVVAMFLTQIDQREIADVLNGDRTAEAQTRVKYEDYTTNLHRALTYSGIETAGLLGLERRAVEREQAGQLQRPDVLGAITDGTEDQAA